MSFSRMELADGSRRNGRRNPHSRFSRTTTSFLFLIVSENSAASIHHKIFPRGDAISVTVFAKNFGSCAVSDGSLHSRSPFLDSLRAGSPRRLGSLSTSDSEPSSRFSIRYRSSPYAFRWCSLPDAAVAEVLACRKRADESSRRDDGARTLEAFTRRRQPRRREGEIRPLHRPQDTVSRLRRLITNFIAEEYVLMLVCASRI